jgi:hypothetical protein
MSSQYFDTTNHKKSQCDFTFKADQVPKLWATTWSSQGLCQLLTNNQLLTKSPSWVWIESQFHKTDQVPKLWATIWSSLDLYQLLTSNQLLIKSNPNEHQYKSNWCLIGGGSFCKKNLFGRVCDPFSRLSPPWKKELGDELRKKDTEIPLSVH